MPRPFEGRYGISLAVAIVALSPFIVVSTAYPMFAKEVQAELGMRRLATELIAGFAIAGYAFGAFAGGDLIQRFRQRHLFLIAEALFVAGCAVSAAAGTHSCSGSAASSVVSRRACCW
jgi:predicted MFS family arabinose efflux permease